MQGFDAYKTFLGMSQHFSTKSNYNGWDYNFSAKVNPKTFSSKKSLVYQYAKIERDCESSKLNLIKFYYPAFLNYGFLRPSEVFKVRKANNDFSKRNLLTEFSEYMDLVLAKIDSPQELFTKVNGIPNIYFIADIKGVGIEIKSILFIIISSLNSVTSDEDIVYSDWKDKIDFHKSFMLNFIQDDIEEFKSLALLKLKHLNTKTLKY